MLSNTIINTLDFLEIYLTPLPYDIYNEANNAGNIAYAGIGLGLINAQKIFWIANCGTVLIFYYQLNNILLTTFIIYLYYHSISKTIYLLHLSTNNTCK